MALTNLEISRLASKSKLYPGIKTNALIIVYFGDVGSKQKLSARANIASGPTLTVTTASKPLHDLKVGDSTRR